MVRKNLVVSRIRGEMSLVGYDGSTGSRPPQPVSPFSYATEALPAIDVSQDLSAVRS